MVWMMVVACRGTGSGARPGSPWRRRPTRPCDDITLETHDVVVLSDDVTGPSNMKTIRFRNPIIPEDCCVLCRQRDDTPDQFGERVYLEKEKLTIHYLCLLTASGVYQRGEEDDGVFGFLVDDIIKETRRCSRLTCGVCKRKGAAVGCCVGSCKKKVHFPCGPNQFIFQFSGDFMSYCVEHGPKQSLGPGALNVSLPQACSVCLDPLPPLLGYSVLKCPSCHTSWFHRACIQRQAISAGLHFFRCTLCNNKERFQEEMHTMGIYIPERDASWELESNAFEELLQVYENCDAPDCCCRQGRSHSAKTGWFEIVRCMLCGSRGTHRRCSGLDLDSSWACLDCTQPEELRGQLFCSGWTPAPEEPGSPKRCASPIPPLQSASPPGPDSSSLVEVQEEGEVLGVALELVRRPDFDPRRRLFVRFKDGPETPFPSCPGGSEAATQWFLKQLVQQIQSCEVFEGPDGHKNLALDAEAMRGGLYLAAVCKDNGFFSLSVPSWFSTTKHVRRFEQKIGSKTDAQCSRTCLNSVNIVFLIDGSSSVGDVNFRLVLDFLTAIAQSFDISDVGSRIGAVQYTYEQRKEFGLSDFLSKEEVVAGLSKIRYMNGGTATGQAINYVTENLFKPSVPGRNFLIIVTDGQSYDDIGGPAQNAQKHGITVFAVGTAWAPMEDLRAMASQPLDRHTYFSREFSGLKAFSQDVVRAICQDFSSNN
ncbi:unnamed protein product [Arctogadus glacialis]